MGHPSRCWRGGCASIASRAARRVTRARFLRAAAQAGTGMDPRAGGFHDREFALAALPCRWPPPVAQALLPVLHKHAQCVSGTGPSDPQGEHECLCSTAPRTRSGSPHRKEAGAGPPAVGVNGRRFPAEIKWWRGFSGGRIWRRGRRRRRRWRTIWRPVRYGGADCHPWRL